MNSKRIFFDKELNQSFWEKGFVKFSLLDENEINTLNRFYIEQIDRPQKTRTEALLHATNMTYDKELKEKVFRFIKQSLGDVLKKHFVDFQYVTLNYIVKEPSADSYVPPHMDWTYVDETQFTSFNVWICLEDSDHNNGNMQFLPGSHLFKDYIRVNPWQPFYFNDYLDKVAQLMIDVPTKKGECLVFHNSLIHGSSKNTSNHARVTCLATLCPKEADLVHYYWRKDLAKDKVEKYSITTKSLIEMKKDSRPPHAKFEGYVDYNMKEVPYAEFVKLTKKSTSIAQRFRNKMFSFFK